MFQIRWLNKEKTEGEVWRTKDYANLPPAPILEGTIKFQKNENSSN
jgi:hypothetical protein